MEGIQILQSPLYHGGTGNDLINAFGTGLQVLAHHKLNDMLQEKETARKAQFWRALNVPETTARQLAQAPDALQKSILERLGGLGEPQQFLGEPEQFPTAQQIPSAPSNMRNIPEMTQPKQPIETTTKQTAGLKLEPTKEQRKMIEHNYKETAKLRNELLIKSKAAKSKLRDLERFEELNSKGNLDTPGYISFLEKSGFDIPALMKPDSEEFQKLQATQLKDIGNTFKGSITNNEINQYLKTIPSLLQSPEGRKRLIAMQKLEEKAHIAHAEAAKEIISKNRGVPPLDLEERIDDAVEPKLEKLAQQFRKELEKPVPKGQNKAITALQTALGKAAGNIGLGALGVGAGAAYGGSRAGVPGAILGGALGGVAGLSGVTPKSILGL